MSGVIIPKDPPSLGPTQLERTLARIVIELCMARGHDTDGDCTSVPKGRCACECVPPELVPQEYR